MDQQTLVKYERVHPGAMTLLRKERWLFLRVGFGKLVTVGWVLSEAQSSFRGGDETQFTHPGTHTTTHTSAHANVRRYENRPLA